STPKPTGISFLVTCGKLCWDALNMTCANFIPFLRHQDERGCMYQRPTTLRISRQSQPTATKYSGFMCTKTKSYSRRKPMTYLYKRKRYFVRERPFSFPRLCTETFLGRVCRPSLRQMTCTCSAFLANSSIHAWKKDNTGSSRSTA